MPNVVLDFETANLVLDEIVIGSQRGLGVVGAAVYSEHWATEILCLRWRVEASADIRLWRPGHPSTEDLFNLTLNPGFTFVAHGAGFEKAIWRNIMMPRYGFPDVPNERWECTQANCAMHQVNQKLEKALPQLDLGEKDMVGSALTRKLSRLNKTGKRKGLPVVERTTEIMDRVYEYCAHDVDDEDKLLARLGPMPADERTVWLLDQTINERGVALDLPFVQAAQAVVERASVPLVREFRELTGGLNPSQVGKLTDWLMWQGVELLNMQKATLDALLGDDDDESIQEPSALAGISDDLPGHCRRALAIRRLVSSASIKKLSRMENCLCGDGRSRGLLNYHAAGTGRWAGRLWQPQNLPRGTLKDPATGKAFGPDVVVSAILTGDPQHVERSLAAPPIECVLSSLRHAIVPGRGRLFAAGDFAGVEMRIDLALAGQHDQLEIIKQNPKGAYLAAASANFGRPITVDDVAEYTIGKNIVLGGGFQMGADTFCRRYIPGCMCKGAGGQCQNKDTPQNKSAVQGINTYRNDFAPKVPKLWEGLQEAALLAVQSGEPHEYSHVRYEIKGRWLTATWLPDGSKIWYFDPVACKKAMPWSTEDVRETWRCTMQKNGHSVRTYMYGGILTENIVQHLARQQMVHAMKLCEKEGFPVVLTVHDEIVTEPEAHRADPKLLQQIMSDPTDWARQIGFPIAAECWAGDRYRKG